MNLNDFLIFGVPDFADRSWDVGLTLIGIVLTAAVAAVQGLVNRNVKASDKKLDAHTEKLNELTESHNEQSRMFATALERIENHGQMHKEFKREQRDQWDKIHATRDELSKQGQSLAAHEQSLEFLKQHPSLQPK